MQINRDFGSQPVPLKSLFGMDILLPFLAPTIHGLQAQSNDCCHQQCQSHTQSNCQLMTPVPLQPLHLTLPFLLCFPQIGSQLLHFRRIIEHHFDVRRDFQSPWSSLLKNRNAFECQCCSCSLPYRGGISLTEHAEQYNLVRLLLKEHVN